MKKTDCKNEKQKSKIPWEKDLEDFAEYAEDFGVRFDSIQKEQIFIYLKELVRWNRKINLISYRSFSDLFIKHALDSLVPLKLLEDSATLVDLGTGAGFPGIPLKIALPGLKLILVESRGKKSSFLGQITRILGMEAVSVRQVRAEDTDFQDEFKEIPAEAVITRAALQDEEAIKAGSRILAKKGKILLMKGAISSEDLDNIGKISRGYGKRLIDVAEYRLPGMDKDRNIVIIE